MGRMILNNALRTIVNAERRGKATVELQPISTVMSSFLKIMKNRGYIKDFQVFDPHRVGKITVQLQGRVNDCRALTYRQDVKAKDIEEYKMQKLPTRQWGYVVITTPEGVLDHEEAVKRNVGGQINGRTVGLLLLKTDNNTLSISLHISPTLSDHLSDVSMIGIRLGVWDE
ncbi:unnamed protein product [Prunus armeniaca]|uniref:30S ribosomal protein S8, chloroplastic n=1 Tax=Prunus armeniaca TaxID=36596 RepID=A0A6J5UN00_PRUAR|nr:unnamed protein product [Prunus armeniaca]